MKHPLRALFLAVSIASLVSGTPWSAESDRASGISLGFLLDAGSGSVLPDAPEGAPRYARLVADWGGVETEPGIYDWSSYAGEIDRLRRAGYRVVLGLHGSHPHHLPKGGAPSPLQGASLQAWTEFVRSAARAFAGDVEVLEVWSPAGGGAELSELFEPRDYAFLLKTSALAARAESRALGESIRIAQGAVAVSALAWQQALWAEDSAAYVDVLPLILDRAGEVAAALEAFTRESLLHPPAADLWVYAMAADDPQDPWRQVADAIGGAAAGADVAFARLSGDEELRGEQAAWIAGVSSLLGAGYAPSPRGRVRFTDGGGASRPDAAVLGRFLNGDDFSSVLVYRVPGSPEPLPVQRMIVDTPFVRNPRLIDPVSGGELRTSAGPADDGRGRVIRVLQSDRPGLLVFEKAVAADGFDLPPEEVETTRERELTVEEIVARYQEVQRAQDDALERWTARARIDFHFKFAMGGTTVDVSIDSNYFWERGGAIEWEQTDYYIQGNRVTWKNIPEIPYIQPEKVATLPLDLTLDKTYVYRLVGRGRVGDREAYVVEFDPANGDPDSSLYRGRLWIDTESFVRLQANVVQTGLEAPVLSNEERDVYRAVSGPSGETFWLLDRIDGQQLWTIGGRNLVVRREVTFESYEANPPREQFEAARQRAYASKNQMLRDTPDGYRYLERQEDGTRSVKTEMDSRQIFAAAGAFRDSSTDGVTPLAGVNYFDYDLFGRKVQLNVLFGGVLAFVNASKPDLFGRNIDLSLDAVGVGLATEDRVYSGDDELELERIRTRGQNLSLRLGLPIGQFTKITAIGSVGTRDFFGDDDAEKLYDRIREESAGGVDLRFIRPPGHTLLTGRLLAEYNRRGYTLSVQGSRTSRSEWDEWGLYDEASGTFQVYDPLSGDYAPGDPEPIQRSYSRWGASLFKEWYLKKFQKVRGELGYLDGSDLDRFSRYEFSFLGDDRLSGFSGSGVRFDKGAIARAGYAFNVFEAIRFSAALDHARVEREDSDLGSQSFTGLGISGNVVGPWKTVISLSYGYALDSDIPDLEGESEFFLLILKLF